MDRGKVRFLSMEIRYLGEKSVLTGSYFFEIVGIEKVYA
jgi:hypothetical protein